MKIIRTLLYNAYVIKGFSPNLEAILNTSIAPTNTPTLSGEQDLGEQFIENDADLYTASRGLKAMGHPLRLNILCILAGAEELSVQDLVDRVGTSQSNISQHLSILRDKHILHSRKDANKVYYRIGDQKVLQLIRTTRDAFCSKPLR